MSYHCPPSKSQSLELPSNADMGAHASPRACPRRIGSHHHAIGAYEAV